MFILGEQRCVDPRFRLHFGRLYGARWLLSSMRLGTAGGWGRSGSSERGRLVVSFTGSPLLPSLPALPAEQRRQIGLGSHLHGLNGIVLLFRPLFRFAAAQPAKLLLQPAATSPTSIDPCNQCNLFNPFNFLSILCLTRPGLFGYYSLG